MPIDVNEQSIFKYKSKSLNMITDEDKNKIDELEIIAQHIAYRKSLDFNQPEDSSDNISAQNTFLKMKPTKLDSKTLDHIISDNLVEQEVIYNARTDLNFQNEEDALEEKLFYTEHTHTKLKLEFIDEILQQSASKEDDFDQKQKSKTPPCTNKHPKSKKKNCSKKAYSYLSHDKDEDFADADDDSVESCHIAEPKWEKDAARILEIINKEIDSYSPEELAQEERNLLSLFTSSLS